MYDVIGFLYWKVVPEGVYYIFFDFILKTEMQGLLGLRLYYHRFMLHDEQYL